MKSPNTDYEFHIDEVGLRTALEMTWSCTPEEFVTMFRMCIGLPIGGEESEGPPPMWHLLELMQILLEHDKHENSYCL